MKKIIFVTILFTVFIKAVIAQQNINGAWEQQNNFVETILILKPNYFTVTEFDTANKKFIQSWGGSLTQPGDNQSATIEFHSADNKQVGKKISFKATLENGLLVSNISPQKNQWQLIDNNEGILSGFWVITAREQNGKMNDIIPGERKTIKILTGKRFQWAAINTATGEFFGTGGGAYTLLNGIYTETIEFFSRDNTRVGHSLSFKASVAGDKWEHSGKSSKGDPVHEIWTKLP